MGFILWQALDQRNRQLLPKEPNSVLNASSWVGSGFHWPQQFLLARCLDARDNRHNAIATPFFGSFKDAAPNLRKSFGWQLRLLNAHALATKGRTETCGNAQNVPSTYTRILVGGVGPPREMSKKVSRFLQNTKRK
jgi:hypothetical protein